MTRFERKFLIDLYESSAGLYAFTFFSRYKIRPDELALLINKYYSKGLINYHEDKLLLTENGRNFVVKKIVSFKKSSGNFSNIPEEFMVPRMEINLPYLPNITDVSQEILKITEEGDLETSIKEV
ncbi:MAG TPA: hypothetical protein VKT28_01545 [Puia sp.]|nr:hypothetical protein [Puia sp.]